MTKPEIHWNAEKHQFERDGKAISFEKAFAAWEAVKSADWTKAGHAYMWENCKAMDADTPYFIAINGRGYWGRSHNRKEAVRNAKHKRGDRTKVLSIIWTTLPFFRMCPQRRSDPELADIKDGAVITPYVNGMGDVCFYGKVESRTNPNGEPWKD